MITTLVYDGGQVIEEYENDGTTETLARAFTYGAFIDDVVMMEAPDATNGTNRYYYHKDKRYSIVAITDNSGSLVEEYEYSAFGLMTITDENGDPLTESGLGNPMVTPAGAGMPTPGCGTTATACIRPWWAGSCRKTRPGMWMA